MKRSNLLFIFVFIICMGSFNMDVNAAQELTCLYKKGGSKKVMLIQNNKGKISIYKHEKDASVDDNGWMASSAVPRWGEEKLDLKEWWSSDDEKIENGSLTECPKSKRTLNNGKGSIRFYKTKEGGDGELVEHYNVVKLLEVNSYDSISKEDLKESNAVYGENDYVKSCGNIGQLWFDNFAKSGNNTTTCVYANDLKNGCHIIRMDMSKNKEISFSQIDPLSEKLPQDRFTFRSDNIGVNTNTISKIYNGECPISIYVDRIATGPGGSEQKIATTVYLSKGASGRVEYPRKAQFGSNMNSGEDLSDGEVEINFEKVNILNCEDLFDNNDELLGLVKFFINLVKYLVPILLITFSIIDFAKAIFAGSEDNIKKAQSRFIKRIIISIVIFLVPGLLKLILGIANGIWGNIDSSLCGLL